MRKPKERPPLTPEERVFMKELYETHRQTIYCAARRVTDDLQLAADLMQECCLNLIKNVSTIRKLECCKIDAYIVIVVRRLYINHAKKESKAALLPMDQPSVAAIADRLTADLEQEKQNTKLDAELLLEQLSPRDRLLLQSRYILGMDEKELACAFDCQPNSVRALLSRARKRARAIGEEPGKGDEEQDG